MPIEPAADQAVTGLTRILVVDNDALIRWALEQALQSLAPVKATGSYEGALRLLHETAHEWAVVIADRCVDNGSGVALLDDARGRWPRCVRILLASDLSAAARDEARSVGAALMTKPFRVHELVTRVRAELEATHAIH